MKTKVTAVFDIGRTNKKFFLFNSDFQEVYREYDRFDEITDEDGHPTENLKALVKWARKVFDAMLTSTQYEIIALNFSAYGASLVHLDEAGTPVAPLYNYMKPLDEDVMDAFFEKYGPELEFQRATGALTMGMLNTGLHLYWLKYKKPEIYGETKYSLHLPQYLSYLFTGVPVSEYTSIGCHTMLWNFENDDYHSWVYKEGIDGKLPPIVSSRKTVSVNYKGRVIAVGPGIHDSSSALLPYIRSISKPFLLVSTGTWSISINPFSSGMLSNTDIQGGSMFNMRVDGSPVKVSRLFLGNEYKIQVKALSAHFGVAADYHKTIKFDQDVFFEIKKDFMPMFKWSSFSTDDMTENTIVPYDKFEHAYHQLMYELTLLQVKSIRSAIGESDIIRLYIDGGFSDNEVYLQLLSYLLNTFKISTTEASLGSALGAAIVVSGIPLHPKFLKKNYALKKHNSSISQ